MVTPAPNLKPGAASSPRPAERPAPGGEPGAAPLPRVAIVGTPGSGKTLLFQRLGGRTRGAASPFTTERVEGLEVQLGGRTVALLDTPGTSGLELCSEHEARTRDLLKDRSGPLVVVQC